jgi:FkbM family methyltransferase
MKRWVKSLVPAATLKHVGRFRNQWLRTHGRMSYSQEGEDMILERFLEGRPSGFYVDVGAHHPRRFSNTYRLYLKGWRGLNIDANPGCMRIFQRLRPRDINVEAAVASSSQQLTYHIFNEPALNTFDRELAQQRVSGSYSIVERVSIATAPLWQLLDQYVPERTKIDLLTVDVEGFDYDVLQSNDWGHYPAEFVLVECMEATTMERANSDPVAKLLQAYDYSVVAKTKSTVLFRRQLPAVTP